MFGESDREELKLSGVWVRKGSTTAPASDEAIRRMIKESDGDSFEDMRSLNQDLTFGAAKEEFSRRNVEFTEVQMRTLGLINDEGMYTNLALLLSDQCPHIIKAATFQGVTPEIFHDRHEFTGSIFKQLNDAYEFIELRNQTRAVIEGLYRKDTRDYPEVSLRETMLNAVVHRDYSKNIATMISVYDDRMEFTNYGKLPSDVSVEDIMLGVSSCRNPKLANVFYRLELIEIYGTGIFKIKKGYELFDEEPEFIISDNAFKVILHNCNYKAAMEYQHVLTGQLHAKDENNLRETISWMYMADSIEDSVSEFIKDNEPCSRSKIEAYLETSLSTTARLLRKMKSDGTIRVIGKGKNTRYALTPDKSKK